MSSDRRPPGIRRQQTKDGFRHVREDGRPMSRREKRRVRGLAVPPAWRDVWISASPRARVQATGVDASGRKQYIYNDGWRRRRGVQKFERLHEFGRALPRLRESVEADLAKRGLPKEKAVAAVVRLMEHTFVRVGSRRYARQNRSFGASTLRRPHVEVVDWRRVRFRFRGKAGIRVDVTVDDERLARVVRKCRELPGQTLFEYEEDGTVGQVTSADVNAYIRDATGGEFSSKDLRTWAASVLALHDLLEAGPRDTHGQQMAVLRRMVRRVSGQLRHTPAVCRRDYIHPLVAAAYVDGSLQERVGGLGGSAVQEGRVGGLWLEERRLLALLASYDA